MVVLVHVFGSVAVLVLMTAVCMPSTGMGVAITPGSSSY